MNKVMIGLCALALLIASSAAAQDRRGFDHGGGGRERGGEQGGRFPGNGFAGGGYPGGYPHAAYGGAYGRAPAGQPGYGGYPPAPQRGYAGGYPSPRAGYPPAMAPLGPRGSNHGYSRGQFLPPGGGMVADPRLYHLRRPPNGYSWVTVGPNAYLTQRSTGLILDTAPLY